jgi:hypothetical protein
MLQTIIRHTVDTTPSGLTKSHTNLTAGVKLAALLASSLKTSLGGPSNLFFLDPINDHRLIFNWFVIAFFLVFVGYTASAQHICLRFIM